MNFDVNKIRVRDILQTFLKFPVLGWSIGSTSLLTCRSGAMIDFDELDEAPEPLKSQHGMGRNETQTTTQYRRGGVRFENFNNNPEILSVSTIL